MHAYEWMHAYEMHAYKVQSSTKSDWSISRTRDRPHTHLELCRPISLPIYTPAMPNKTDRREHSSEIIAVILGLHKLGYSASQIQKEEALTKDIPKSTITFQIRRAKKHQNDPFVKPIRTGRPPKLDARAERRLLRFMALNPFETMTCIWKIRLPHACQYYTQVPR
jgi:hypothetical protein